MKISVFSAKPYDKKYLETARAARPKDAPAVDIAYHDCALTRDTAALAKGSDAVCVFVNDNLDEPVIDALAQQGVRAILLRCAGYNSVRLDAADKHGIMVANVPSYSPEAVAEFAVALIQTLNRNTHRAFNRVREGNFALNGLLGCTLYGKTVGLLGTGKIGVAMARIMTGFGCRVIAYDPFPTKAFEEYGTYVSLDELLPVCDIISLHCPLVKDTYHIVNKETLAKMKPGVMLVNTSRGALIDTEAVVDALKSRHLGGVALDVYEREGSLFYSDHSGEIIEDDLFMRLMTFPNALICGHQAFFTHEALTEIADCTLSNMEDFITTGSSKNALTKNGKQVQGQGPVRNV